ncbi:MAG: NAD-dependent epimerase/dehydratase family protein, partial [Dongiaceae bacterium]
AAGFIGFHLSLALLERGDRVTGIDDLNAYYDPTLKEARLARLRARTGFDFHRLDVADLAAMRGFAASGIDAIIHLAAQAGVRHSLKHPEDYVRSNIEGQLAILELARAMPTLRHLVYASSSSVYGDNEKLPFAVTDPVERPASFYGATKRAGELMAISYARLYGTPSTGLRFFTVYGPWGRPDMAAWLFVKAIIEGKPLQLFNGGQMQRDFTYIDDIVAGVVAALDRPPPRDAGHASHRLYNLGNHRSEPLPRFLALLEERCGRKAIVENVPMQQGDVRATYADITESKRDLGFEPKTSIDQGLPRFVDWYRDYHRA